MYHFIGIKGSGMSALAQIMHRLGYPVQGSDYESHMFTQVGLEQLGIPILKFDEKNITTNMKIIRGAAFHSENEEVRKAEELGLEIYSYSEMVGKLTNQFKTICIAGCHGKTTTTSIASHVLNHTVGCNYLIGDGTGYADPINEFFVLESCEYRRHFLNYHPYYSIITNIDLDHVDYFKDIDDVIDAYQEFANKTEKQIIACGDDPYTHRLQVKKPIVYYGIKEDNNIRATHIEYTTTGTCFDVEIEGNYYGTYDLPIYGKHNLLNTLAVISICYYEKMQYNDIMQALKTWTGAKRRFSEIKIGDSIIIDDYAHHPNEVQATLNAIAQKYKDHRLVAIFQPHTYSRTKQFQEDFIKIFKQADEVYILDICGAREKQEDFPNVTAQTMIQALENGHHINMDEAEKLVPYAPAIFAFMGPTDLSKLENQLQQYLEKK